MGSITWRIQHYGECDSLDDVPNGAIIDSIDDVDVYGPCESCGELILEGDDYHCDSEDSDIMLCEKCYREMLESEHICKDCQG